MPDARCDAAKDDRGLVLVLTGDGKGKTTAALGQAVRALGHGKRVLFVQFMKGKKTGEVLCAEQYLPHLNFRQFGLDGFIIKKNPAPEQVKLAGEGFDFAREAVSSGEYQMIVLDEINVAVDFKLVALKDVLELVRSKPPELDLLLTGRYAPPEIIAIADMVSEVKEIKHHYRKGVGERAGIEY